MIALVLAAGTCAPCIIQNARVEVGNGSIRDHATVVIDHGKIFSIDPPTLPPLPEGVRPIDGTGKVLAPGFIATRSVLGVVEVEAEPGANDLEMAPPPPYAGGPPGRSSLVPGFSLAWAFNPSSVWIPVAREEGVTSAVIEPSGGVIAGQGAWVTLTGALTDLPDLARPAAMFGGIGVDAVLRGGGARGAVWLSLFEAFADARFYIEHRAAIDHGDARPLSLSALHLQALIPVIELKVPFAIQADRASDILDAIAFARAERVRLIILGGAESWKVADALAAAKIPVVIEPSKQEPWSFDSIAYRDDLAALLDKADVPLVITSTGFPTSARRVRQEAGMAVGMGLTHEAALKAITLGAAQAFGHDKEVGSIEVGKRADVVLWSADPLELSSVAERMWIGGEEQSLYTRQRALVERYRVQAP
jgi:imidazolonepropionase-like amidohydrolase